MNTSLKGKEMISRRKIISRSTDDLDSDKLVSSEDIWHSEDKLLKDHIQEILHKWDRIDDEIWAKIVCMQRNRRVAKAYARAPVLAINGSYIGFDGYRIGLNGFKNPLTRDAKIEEIKNQIGSGAKIKIDDDGNILIKRIGKENVFVKVWQSIGQKDNCISEDLIKNEGQLIVDKSFKLFDMEKFLENISNELKNSYPDRKHLESQCISCVAFVKDCRNILELPIWIMIINIVALDMLKTKLLTPNLKNKSIPNLLNTQIDCLEFHKNLNQDNQNHNHIDHHKCSANRLTIRRWKSLYPNVFGPLLPPRDYARDEKIRKLKQELEEVRVKIGNIEEKCGCNENKTRYTNAQQKPINEVVVNVKPKRNKQKAVHLQYDSGLESDPYTSDNNAVYGIQQIKCLKKNEVYDTIWE